ncbi:hypothetical protein B0T26DRAFT_801351 [Lasiosphaeria miniovina]|uniref:Exonuclease domain-containing protein n=1 Tax=Lasiosphaeria miniovina TaxID=1954250 RepID=A0AA40AVA3_9PEZI|nr:uncharacterized protein B0T26DRAFT_801351 [Lasiosphaeria miniovina]KAK0722618.1 hypothetical protein B0T26DRAFT_801351 [Lasiosphaeria miniovina]
MASSTIAAPGPVTGIIVPSPTYLDHLESLLPSAEALRQASYVTKKLTDQQLEEKKRCLRCRIRPAQKARQRRDRKNSQDSKRLPIANPRRESTTHTITSDAQASSKGAKPEHLRCKFHLGRVTFKHVSAPPCGGSMNHQMPNDPGGGLLKERWQFHETPTQRQSGHRRAVTIDCEMGTAFNGDGELIRLTAYDYFTGEILIDSLAYPDVAMQHFNTRWSGVKRGDMERACERDQCLRGKVATRAALFQYVQGKPGKGGGKRHPDGLSLKALALSRLGLVI